MSISINKNAYGAYVLGAFHKGYYVQRCYYYYTKKECISLFKGYLKEL